MTEQPKCQEALARRCVEHLEREDRALQRLNQTLHEVRDALRRHDTVGLPNLLEAQQQELRHVADVRRDRADLRDELAQALGISSAQATIARWAETLSPEDRRQVMQSRDRLATRAQETAALADGSIAVVARGLQILADVMQVLTGSPRHSGRYLPDGSLDHQATTHYYQNQF